MLSTWQQPALSSNGTWNGDNFAVYCIDNGNAYKAVDGNSATDLVITGYQSVAFNLYFPESINPTNVRVTNNHNANGYGITSYTVSCSNNQTTWDSFGSVSMNLTDSYAGMCTISTDKFYKYMQITLNASNLYGYQTSVREISVNGYYYIEGEPDYLNCVAAKNEHIWCIKY